MSPPENNEPSAQPEPFRPEPAEPRELAKPACPPAQTDEALSELAAAEAAEALEDWKAEVRREVETWLEALEEIPEVDLGEEPPETPDLYAFYAQWAAANAEARKGNRRTAEAFSQWGETLGRFESDVKLLREHLQRLSAATAAEAGLSRSHCLVLVELLDRLQRVTRAFASPPASSWWGGTGPWRQAWNSQRQALDILQGHFEALLKKEGLERIETAGQPFDPATMAAVAAEPDPSRPDQTILEEVAPGYRRRGELLRAAQVKVSLNKSSHPTV